MDKSLTYNDIDEICGFLTRAGYSFGYCVIEDEETGQRQWQADAFNGDGISHLVARGSDLATALHKIMTGIVKMN